MARRRRGGGRGSGNGHRGHPRGRAREGVGFWGDPSLLPDGEAGVRITDDPHAVPRSLGEPPLPGHRAVAEHYFAAIYDRAVTVAGALAAAGGLIDPEQLEHHEED